MFMKMFNKRHLIITIIIVMTLVMLPIQALAKEEASVGGALGGTAGGASGGASGGAQREPVDVECQLNVNYNYGDIPVADADFYVYKVGDIYMDGETQLTGEFAELDIDFSDAAQLKMAGITMYNFASEKGIQPDHIITTNSEGKVSLLSLDAGIYLIAGQPLIEGDDGYFTDPQVIFFPLNPGLDDEYWNSNITIQPKATMRCILDPLVYKTKKIWADDGAEKYRPDEITVRLYQNGIEYDKVVLSKDNNWSYTWKDLDPKSEWTLKEDVVLDYSADISLENDTFIVTNTFEGEIAPSDENIHQTGLLWWPVPLMAFVGMALVILGMFVTRKEQ